MSAAAPPADRPQPAGIATVGSEADTPLHLIAELWVRDPDKLLEYGRRVQRLMRRAGGEIVGVSTTGAEVREGAREPGLLIIHRWRSRAAFEAFWESPEYEALRRLRHQASDARIVTFESTAPDFSA